MGEEHTAFPYSRIPIHKYRGNDGHLKSHFANTPLIIVAGKKKNHRWLLKLVGENVVKNWIFAQSQSISPPYAH